MNFGLSPTPLGRLKLWSHKCGITLRLGPRSAGTRRSRPSGGDGRALREAFWKTSAARLWSTELRGGVSPPLNPLQRSMARYKTQAKRKRAISVSTSASSGDASEPAAPLRGRPRGACARDSCYGPSAQWLLRTPAVGRQPDVLSVVSVGSPFCLQRLSFRKKTHSAPQLFRPCSGEANQPTEGRYGAVSPDSPHAAAGGRRCDDGRPAARPWCVSSLV